MFEILVTDFDKAQQRMQSGWPTRVVSVLMQYVPNLGTHHLHVRFNDVHAIDKNALNPQLRHLQLILGFTKNLTDEDRVLVHCLGGISRSTAIAIAILIQHGMSFQDAYDHIAAIRPILAPNKLLISYIDEHFGLNGQLIALIKEKEPKLIQ